ncbi:MAG TPA: hypothetical protein VMW75_14515 [Thermoanaerobaculia bacterium]|nr:hypothetical protein [Thermoanaerobaculia bacterium]
MDQEPDLQSVKAWALFRGGRLKEAEQLNGRLLQRRSHVQDLDLDINLALASGRWEHFPVIVEREWPRRAEHPPETLLRLASLAAETGASSDRAWELAKLAVHKAGSDPHVIMSALSLMYRLGRDGQPEGSAWLSQALALSSDSGPIRRMDLATVVQEWLPAQRDHRRMMEERWLRGEIPLHFAAAQLDAPLAQLLIGFPRDNETLLDGRRRILLPIVSELRQPLSMQPEWVIGLDITSLLILAHLGLLDRVIAAFAKVILAPETLLILLNERNRVRFQQPARAAAAQALRGMLDERQLREAETPRGNIDDLAAEVGTDLAQLLQAAKESGGRVVRHLPIYKLRSLMTEPAALGEYERLICSTVDLEQVLFTLGHLDGTLHQRASAYLLSQDRPSAAANDLSFLSRPLYLDDVAVTFLQTSGVLPAMFAAGLDLRVHSSLRQDTSRLIATAQEGEQLAASLDQIRVVLRTGLDCGKIELLPRHDPSDEQQPWIFEAAPTILQFREDSGSCDAVCIDDRFFNKGTTLTDRRERTVPVVCVLDLLGFLESLGTIAPPEGTALRHRLRRSGFVFLPLMPADLASVVGTAQWREDGGLIESAELRGLRQSLARLRALPQLHEPVKQDLASALLTTAVWVIRQLWDEPDLPTERAAQLSSWIWHHLAPVPDDWLTGAARAAGLATEAFAQQVTLLLVPLSSSAPPPRPDAYLDWVEASVLDPLLPANPRALARIGELAGRQIEGSASNTPQHAAAFAHWLFSRQPRRIRDWLAENFAFRPELGFHFKRNLSIAGMATFEPEALFSAARSLWASHEDQNLSTVDGKRVVLTLRGGIACLDLPGEQGQALELRLQELEVFANDRRARLDACDGLLRRLGPTSPEIASLRQVADERGLTDGELHQLFGAIETAVLPRHELLREALAQGHLSLDDLVPDSLAYFERFCGPDPGAANPETYLTSTLRDHRQELLRRDLTHGLRICLPGALRDDLCPGEWLDPYADDEVWDALQACQPEAEPISLLAALDVALRRQHDSRFAQFADKAISTLLGETFRLPGGGDFYRLFPPLMELALETISFLEGAMARPPFWRRMCAWMQAGLVTRLMPGADLDHDAVAASLTPAGHCAKLVDLRQEPLVHPGQLSTPFIRAELLGRLLLLTGRHQTAGRPVPRADEIEQAFRRRNDQETSHLAFMPGPLEGHRRIGEELPAHFEAQVRDLPSADLAPPLVHLSRTWHVPDEFLSRLRAAITGHNEEQAPGVQLSRLGHASLLAAAERDRELADAVATAAAALAPRLTAPVEIAKLFHSLLIAAAAMQDEAAWAEWLQCRLGELAGHVPAGHAALVYWHHLDFLQRVTKLSLGIGAQAAALASAGMF